MKASKSAQSFGVVLGKGPVVVMVVTPEQLGEYLTHQQVREISGLSKEYITHCLRGAPGYPLLRAVRLPGNTYTTIRRVDYEEWLAAIRKHERAVVPGAPCLRKQQGQEVA